MREATYVGRIGGLAIALGIGAGIVTMPALAGAEPASDRSDTTSASETGETRGKDDVRRGTEPLTSLVKTRQGARSEAGVAAIAAADRPTFSVSVNGWNVIGTSASSTKGSAAVVYGVNSTAAADGRGNLAPATAAPTTPPYSPTPATSSATWR